MARRFAALVEAWEEAWNEESGLAPMSQQPSPEGGWRSAALRAPRMSKRTRHPPFAGEDGGGFGGNDSGRKREDK